MDGIDVKRVWWNYVVQTFTRTGSEVSYFTTLEFARKHVELNPCSMIFRTEQVSRVVDGYVHLKAHDHMPVE